MRTRIVVEQIAENRWRAWFAGNGDYACEGRTGGTAIANLLRDSGHDPKNLLAYFRYNHAGQAEFPFQGEPCPDCRGSGTYVGLNTVERCRRCHGAGMV